MPEREAHIGLAILYGALCLTNLLCASQITVMIGEKLAILIGGIGFVAFMIAQGKWCAYIKDGFVIR